VPWVTDPEKKSKHLRKDLSARVTVLDVYTAAAIRLLLFTGARLREILGLRWDDIDWKNGLATAWKHKYTRTKGKKVITLNPPALQLLADLDEKEQELEKLQGWRSEFIVAGKYIDAPRADLQNPWNAVRRHANLPNLRLHDLRHNFASFGVGGNMGLPLIGKLLGHASTQSTERYANLRRDPQRQATANIGRLLAVAIGEEIRTNEAEVAELPAFISKA
jgi:integrase